MVRLDKSHLKLYSSLKAILGFSILQMVVTEAIPMVVETAMATMEETMNQENNSQGLNRSSRLSH